MKIRIKPVETEARFWHNIGQPDNLAVNADNIVKWINANGGEARYTHGGYGPGQIEARILVRTNSDWAPVAPGWWVVMGSDEFRVSDIHGRWKLHLVRDFYSCDPETFSQRWDIIE